MKLQFFPFSRWCAVYLDGESQGYMDSFQGQTRLHLGKDAPRWLIDVRRAGPWSDNTKCQAAIRAAWVTAGQDNLPRDLLSCTV